MISNEGAIWRLKNRDRWIQSKISDCLRAGEPVDWFLMDRESIAIAIAAIEFVIATESYEASQNTT